MNSENNSEADEIEKSESEKDIKEDTEDFSFNQDDSDVKPNKEISSTDEIADDETLKKPEHTPVNNNNQEPDEGG